MAIKTKLNIFKNMTKTELEKEISNYTIHYRYYQRLLAMKMIADGHSITYVANELNRAYPTVHKWVCTCEKEGLLGLKPSFAGGGENAKLTKSQLLKLDVLIEKDPDMTLKQLRTLIKTTFDVEYTTKQVRIIAGKLGYDYRKESPKFCKLTTLT